MQDLFTSFKDNCGFGLLASIDNKPSHKNLEDAITSLERMMHRGAIAADGKSGDGSGLLFSLPKDFFRKKAKEFGEKAKIAIRNIRREANDEIKKMFKNKEITEDDQKRGLDKIQEITDEFVEKVDEIVSKKIDDVMKI